jgi:PAS domain S-box-containing protein
MKNEKKTKKELIKELEKLRRRIGKLKKSEEADYRWARDALRESEARYKALFDRTLYCVFVLDFEGRFLDANNAALNLLGYTKEEMLSVNVASLLDRDQMPRALKTLEEIKRTGSQKGHTEYKLRRKDGGYVWVETEASMIFKQGKFYAIQGIARDITERKRMEDALRKAADEWRRTLDTISDMIMLIDSKSRIVRANLELSSKFDLDLSEILGKPYHHLIYGTDSPPGFCPYLETLADGKEHTQERHLDVFDRDYMVTSSPLLDEEGHLAGSVLVLRDITEKKKIVEHQQKAERLETIGILAGGIAHDFNNMLMAIMGNIQLAKMECNPDDEIFEALTEAENASLRARDLTHQLLTFSKGGAPIKKTAYIADLIKDSAGFALRGSNVRCEFSLPDDLWPVEIDEGQISQVINNLIINADHAMPEGGTIKVNAENMTIGSEESLPLQHGKYVKMSLKDHGVGIPPAHLPKIFDPYFTTKQKGSGLGLATSYSIIKKHDGYINVESEMGVGTTFDIYLPASRQEKMEKRAEAEGFFFGRGKILAMDDEENIRSFIRRTLQLIGYEVELASDGAEAIELYKKATASSQAFDAVILDLTVPGGMGGKETIKKILKLNPDVKAIVSSGYANDPIMAEYEKYGFKGVIAKPYKIRELSEVLHRLTVQKNQ